MIQETCINQINEVVCLCGEPFFMLVIYVTSHPGRLV